MRITRCDMTYVGVYELLVGLFTGRNDRGLPVSLNKTHSAYMNVLQLSFIAGVQSFFEIYLKSLDFIHHAHTPLSRVFCRAGNMRRQGNQHSKTMHSKDVGN